MLIIKKLGNIAELSIIRINRFVQYIGMIAVILMMLITVVHAVGRYAFDEPVPGIVELSGYLLVTAVFLLIGNAMVEKRHISIGLIVDSLSKRKQAIIDSITLLMALVFSAATCWETLVRAEFIMRRGQASTILHIPNYPFYFVVGFGWALFSLAIALHLAYSIRRAVSR